MDRRKTLPILLAIAVVACGGRDKGMKRGQQQYDVVEEGAASGVSSTINPLNEPAPPLATNTAIDTTTNFTLPNTQSPMTSTDPGSIAGSFPTSDPPVYSTPRPRRQPAPEPQPMASSSPNESVAQNTDTSAPPPATNTTASASSANDPAAHVEGENKNTEKKDEKKNEPPPPPPPATATDTGGQ